MEDKLIEAIRAYLPRNVIERRLNAPSSLDVLGGFLEGTLVFADISGFTSMSERLAQKGREGAEELTGILNRYFTCMLEIASAYQGIQIKFGGDAMLLLFEGERHEARAVRSALLMQKAMSRFKRVSTSQGPFGLRMSIGVNTGRFFEAHVGTPDKRLYYVLTGKDVNRTAEIEGQARAGEVLVSPRTANRLKADLEITGAKGDCQLVGGLHSRVARTSGNGSDSLLTGEETAEAVRKLEALPAWTAP